MSFTGEIRGWKLPRVKAYAQLSALGGECTWTNPADCINAFRNARLELQDVYTKIIQMNNSYQVALELLQSSGKQDSATLELIGYTDQRSQEARSLLTQAVGVANALEAEIAKWSWIPGFDTIFLNGLRGLGAIPMIAASVPLSIFYTIAGVASFAAIAWAVGEIASTLRRDTDVQIARHNAWATV